VQCERNLLLGELRLLHGDTLLRASITGILYF
jgi:hypothetical protein